MKATRWLKVVVGTMVLLLLVAACLIARLEWQIHGMGGWQDELYVYVGMTASQQASDDFYDGKIRLLKLDGESDGWQFTGDNEGPFEIWTRTFYPSLGVGHHYAGEQYAAFYNRDMRYMFEHPDEFKQKPKRDDATK